MWQYVHGMAHLAQRYNLHREGVLVVVRHVVRVVRHELLVVAEPRGHHALQEVDKLERMAARLIVEVNACASNDVDAKEMTSGFAGIAPAAKGSGNLGSR